jgi:hypothetical protein
MMFAWRDSIRASHSMSVTNLIDFAAIDHRDDVGYRQRLLLVMGDEQLRPPRRTVSAAAGWFSLAVRAAEFGRGLRPDWSIFHNMVESLDSRTSRPMVVAAGAFGFCAAYILVLSFALPALLVGPAGAPRLSAGMFAISYTLVFLVTLLAGALWDTTHVAASAFLPVLASSAVVTLLGPRLCALASSEAALREDDRTQADAAPP